MTLHCSSAGHGILAAHTQTIEKQGNNVHGDPTLLSYTPHCCEKNCSNQHDHDILNQTPSSANPITNNANHDLTADNADNFEVIDGRNRIGGANFVCLPTCGEYSLKQTLEIADGEQGVTFDEQAHTGDDVNTEVIVDRFEGVCLEGSAEEVQFATCFGVGLCVDPFDTLTVGEVGPVSCAFVEIVGEEIIFKEIFDVFWIPLLHAGHLRDFIIRQFAGSH